MTKLIKGVNRQEDVEDRCRLGFEEMRRIKE